MAGKRCPHCGMDSEGRGIMAADPNAEKASFHKILWTAVAVVVVVVFALLLSPTT